MIACRQQLPSQAGEYNVAVDGVRTLLPLFLYFDGSRWHGLAEMERRYHSTVRWFPNDPLGGPFKPGTQGGPL